MRDRSDEGLVAVGDELPSGTAKHQMVQQMFDAIAPRYDLLNTLMTFGLDRHWRRLTVGLLGLAPGGRVLDLASGTGELSVALRSYGLRAVGADLSIEMLLAGGVRSADAVQGDAASLPFADGSLDGVVSGFALRNFSDLPGTFSEIARILRPAGRVALLEVNTPRHPVLRAGHALWFTQVVPRLGSLLSDPAAYRYLPRSVAYLPGRDALTSALEAAGFRRVEQHLLTGGLTQVVTATRIGEYGISTGNDR